MYDMFLAIFMIHFRAVKMQYQDLSVILQSFDMSKTPYINSKRWVWPRPSNSDHQDYYSFSRESLYINLHLPLLLGGYHTQNKCLEQRNQKKRMEDPEKNPFEGHIFPTKKKTSCPKVFQAG